MSSRNSLMAAALLAAIVGALLLPLLGVAGTVVDQPAPARERAAPPSKLYHVRCWQYGRLLFEERDLDLSVDTVGGLKLRGTDRNGRPVVVSDTGNATCLIRTQPRR